MCQAGLTGSELMLPEDSYEVSGGVEQHPGKMAVPDEALCLEVVKQHCGRAETSAGCLLGQREMAYAVSA